MAFNWKTIFRKGFAWVNQRFVLAMMGFFAIGNAYTMRVCLSVAIVDMVADPESDTLDQTLTNQSTCEGCNAADNATKMEYVSTGTFLWSEETQGIILSSFFWGYVLTQIPGGLLAEKIGGKHLVGFGILLTSILTLITPSVACWGGGSWLIGLRIVEGLGEGVTYPALNLMLAKWAPPTERSMLGTLVYSGSMIGTVFGMALSGVVIEKCGWESVFYLFGVLGIIFYIFWLVLCYDDPRQHPFAAEKEVSYIEECLDQHKRRSEICFTPWRAILTSVPLWGLIVGQIGHDWGFYTLLNDLPKYMNDILHFNITMNGYLSALPYLAMWIVSILSSWLADWLLAKHYVNTTNVRRLFSTIASIGPSVCLFIVAYMTESDRGAVVAILTVGVGAMGTFYPGMKVNSLDLSPNYAGTLMGITNGAGNICGILSPYIIGLITTEHTLQEWRTVFFISIGIFIFTSIVFVVTVSGETQSWNNPDPCSWEMSEGLSTKPHASGYGSLEDRND